MSKTQAFSFKISIRIKPPILFKQMLENYELETEHILYHMEAKIITLLINHKYKRGYSHGIIILNP